MNTKSKNSDVVINATVTNYLGGHGSDPVNVEKEIFRVTEEVIKLDFKTIKSCCLIICGMTLVLKLDKVS